MWSKPKAFVGLVGVYEHRPHIINGRKTGDWLRCPNCMKETWGCFVGEASEARNMHHPGCGPRATAD